jgi:hypothetical protein
MICPGRDALELNARSSSERSARTPQVGSSAARLGVDHECNAGPIALKVSKVLGDRARAEWEIDRSMQR